MSSWSGKSQGNLLGYKIFVGTIRKFGLRFAYFILGFVAFYYFLFAKKSSRPILNYFRERLGQTKTQALKNLYRNYFIFGQILIDKIAILSGLKHKYSYNFEGENFLHQLVEEKTGGIIVNAHIGNFEIAGQLLERLNTKINVLMVDEEHAQIKDYLDNVMSDKKINIIPITKEYTHVLQIGQALTNKELIAMNGDRFVEKSKLVNINFLGKPANFPTGPFTLAARFQVPVIFAFALKESSKHYHFYATPPIHVKKYDDVALQDKEIKRMVELYVDKLEEMIEKYPLQWFNYYDFWSQ